MINVPKEVLRKKMREQFEKHRGVNDISAINRLLWRGRNELNEAVFLYKTTAHVLKMFGLTEPSPSPALQQSSLLTGDAQTGWRKRYADLLENNNALIKFWEREESVRGNGKSIGE